MKNMEKKTFRIIALTLVVGLLIGSSLGVFVYGAQDNKKDEPKTKIEKQEIEPAVVTNDETVYLITGANGNVKQTIVSEKGNLHYDGYENATLPVTMTIKYTLNGNDISPKDLAGKSGRVTMNIAYNNNLKSGNVWVPFLVMSGMVLDNEHFSHIDVINGKAIDDGSRAIVVGYSFPGVEESLGLSRSQLDIPNTVKVSADVKNFQLTTIMTMATNEVFNELDLSKVNSIGDIEKTVGQLTSGVKELVNGTEKLYKGSEQLKAKSVDLAEGTEVLKTGAANLYAGTTALNKGVDTLDTGLGQLSKNSAVLNGGAKQIMESLVKTADGGLTEIRSAFSKMGKTIPTLTVENYSAVFTEVINTLKAIDGQKGTNTYTNTIASLEAAKGQLDSCNTFYQGVLSYTAGVDKAAKGTTSLKDGAVKLEVGAKQLSDGMVALSIGESKLIGGIGQLNKGAKQLNDGVSKMQKEMLKKIGALKDGDIEKVINRIKEMGNASENYSAFGSIGNYDNVKFIFRTEQIGK